MAKTLARVLSIPFSISDCTPFTQSGYIGEDAETCVHRLLVAADYDVEQAERGIIVLDEVDKLAAVKVSHGKDVGGEGVQQALLKIIEGTTVQVQAKPEKGAAPRGAGGGGSSSPNINSHYPSSTSPLWNQSYPSPSSGGGSPPSNSKGEVYNVRTDNILFIFSGAFVGLDKLVMDRISRGSIGFGQPVRSAASRSGDSSSSFKSGNTQQPIPILPGSEEEALYKKHLPFYIPESSSSSSSSTSTTNDTTNKEPTYFNPLDLLTPTDLQNYGFIPEFIGRIPVNAALSALTQPLLLRILTEPRNSLLTQYTSLFSLSGVELRFTIPALHKVASNALNMGNGTGARALRSELETILADAMFETPGSSVKFVLVTFAAAARDARPVYFSRGQGGRFHSMISAEDGRWEEEEAARVQQSSPRRGPGESDDDGRESWSTPASNFEEYRKRAIGGSS